MPLAAGTVPVMATLSTQISLSPVISNFTTAPFLSSAVLIVFVMVPHDPPLSVGQTLARVAESIVWTSCAPTYSLRASLALPVPEVNVSREQSKAMDADPRPPRSTVRWMLYSLLSGLKYSEFLGLPMLVAILILPASALLSSPVSVQAVAQPDPVLYDSVLLVPKLSVTDLVYAGLSAVTVPFSVRPAGSVSSTTRPVWVVVSVLVTVTMYMKVSPTFSGPAVVAVLVIASGGRPG